MPDHRIRVCYTLNTFDLGGAETVALNLARSHDPARFDVEVVAFTEPKRECESEMRRRFREAGVRTHAIVQPNYRSPLAAWRIWRYLRGGRFDVVLGHNRGADLWGVRVGALVGVPALFWTRHLVYHGMTARHARRYRNAAQRTWRVIAVSETVRRACTAVEGIPAERVETVVNGIDTARFRVLGPAERGRVRAALGIGQGDRMVLFVGRFSEQKAPEAFVSMVDRLSGRLPGVRGFMCGYGPLEPQVRAAAAGGAVTVLGLRADVSDLLAACDLFVSTSRNEGLPLNVMEAMATGAAFVAPGIPQIAELTAGSPDLAGQLVAPPPLAGPIPDELLVAWADMAAATLADEGRRLRAGTAGRDIISRRFSIATMVGRYEELYLDALAAQRTRRTEP